MSKKIMYTELFEFRGKILKPPLDRWFNWFFSLSYWYCERIFGNL